MENKKSNANTLVGWSGIALIGAAICCMVYAFVGPDETKDGIFQNPNFVLGNNFNTLRHLFTAFGLIGLFLYQGEKARFWNAVGFLVFFFASVLATGIDIVKANVLPYLASQITEVTNMTNFSAGLQPILGGLLSWIMVMLLLFLIGPIFIGIATIRSSKLAAWVGWVLIFTNLLQYGNMFGLHFLHVAGVALFGATWGYIGWHLVQHSK